jgi:hypothetical protein
MLVENVVDRAVEGIADGAPVDWLALESGAQNDEEREHLKCLRIVGEIENLHRSTEAEPPHTAESAVTFVADSESPRERHDIWGKYRLTQKVGEGSYGSVYRAWDQELEREIAIKILHRQVTDRELNRRLLAEGRALARVQHHNVVSVFGVESHGDRVGLCMEFVQGKTLEVELGERRRFEPREAMLIGQDVCRALAAVHLAGFVHRDVKARNVMREPGGRTVLMDFGTGRETGHERAFDIAGTPIYMAPEVFEGEPATPRSDVYSVGVLVYHLVTGEYPVQGWTISDVRDEHRIGRRKPLSERRPDLSPRFLRVVENALASDPEERYPTAGKLLEAFEALTRERVSIGRIVSIAIMATAATAGLLMAMGLLTSRVFNAALGRGDFSDDSWRVWLVWGARACVGPVVVLAFILIGIGLAIVVRKLVLQLSARARTLDTATQRLLHDAAQRLHLDQVPVVASIVLLASAVVLPAAWWHFSPQLSSVMTDMTTAAPETLRPLAPGPNGQLNVFQDSYRTAFIWIVDLSILAWYAIARMAKRKHEALHWAVIAGAAAVIILALGSADFPFRVINPYNRFDAVKWHENSCYIIGEREDQLLLFCPTLGPSRNRVVHADDTNLERTGVQESIFTPFGDDDSLRK